MKKQQIQLLAITILLLSFNSFSQSADFLTINNVRARIDANTLFHDQTSAAPSFEAPLGSGSHSIYTASLWLAGKDQGGIIKTNVNTYYSATQSIAGPIMTSSYYASEGVSWDKVWKIQCQEIQEFVAWYQAGVDDALNGTTTQITNFPGYIIPAVIINWPGNGDVSKGQAYQLAPFFDRDSDGFYDPNTGDYPLVKGDEAIFFIYNDERPFYDGNDTHAPMKTEVHGLAYAFASNDAALNNTVFLNYKIYNRSTINYDSCYVGFWVDFDLGNYADDYLGVDVTRNSFYAYNGDNNDETGNGIIGYGTDLPAQSVTFLKGAKQNNDGIDNAVGVNTNQSINGSGFGDGIQDNEYWGLERFIGYSAGNGMFLGDGDPVTETDYYNYLQGNWKDGFQMVHGGNGNAASTGGTVPTKYLYPGNSDPFLYGTGGAVQSPSNWSEVTEGNPPGDRRGIGSTGPFLMPAGAIIEIDLALVFGRDMTGTGPQEGVLVMQERIDSIISYYGNGLTSNCDANGFVTGIKSNKFYQKTFGLYPNPFNDSFSINYELQNNTAILEIYNMVGEKIALQTITQKSTTIDLSSNANGIYFITIIDGDKRMSRKVVKQ